MVLILFLARWGWMRHDELGKKYEDCFCDECKEKIVKEMDKLSKFDLLRPKKMANKFKKLCCKECESKIVGRMNR